MDDDTNNPKKEGFLFYVGLLTFIISLITLILCFLRVLPREWAPKALIALYIATIIIGSTWPDDDNDGRTMDVY